MDDASRHVDEFDVNAAVDRLLLRCPPPPLADWQKRIIIPAIRRHYADRRASMNGGVRDATTS